MRIGTAGIVTNEYNHILLIQRDDTRTWCEPGGSLEFGRLPTDNVAQEVREETGMIVLPVRLVALNYWPRKPHGALGFIFRCLIRGGEPAPSTESLQVGFFSQAKLPRPILDFHWQTIQDGWFHKGGPPVLRQRRISLSDRVALFLLTNFIYPFKNRRRRRQGNEYIPPPIWSVRVQVIARNSSGEILWLEQNAGLGLPGCELTKADEAPWETAVRLLQEHTGLPAKIIHVPVVTVKKESSEMTITFTAELPATTALPSLLFTTEIPAAAHPADATLIKLALNEQEETVFRYTEPPV